ncbi:MAG: conjugal transfer protein TraB, partial [Selenomonas sp.]|nr:conjugal transfer protein TraB [Selenomonas sp.]
MEKNQKNRSPQHDGGGMLAQVQASVEILSPVPLGGKCGEKDYERLFIR